MFQPDDGPHKSDAANEAVLVLRNLLQCTHPLEYMVRAGVRQALDVMLHKMAVISKATMFNAE